MPTDNLEEEFTMKLLTAELRRTLPPLRSQEKAESPTVFCKFFCPWNNWTWYATEGESEAGDYIFFGYTVGHEGEWGNFLLSEMESVRGPAGLTIERDLSFKPGPANKVIPHLRDDNGQ